MSANSYTGVVVVPVTGSNDNIPKIEDEQLPNNNDSHPKGRTKIVISIFEKLNMLFLLFLVCYLSWTIPANYGLFSGVKNKEDGHKNSTLQGSPKYETDESNRTEGVVSHNENSTEFQRKLYGQVELSKLGKQYSSKWRKKNRDKEVSSVKIAGNSIVENDNKSTVSQTRKKKNKKARRKNKKKNKSRKKKVKHRMDNKLKPTTIRHIIEKVAEEALTRTSGSWHYSDIPRKGNPVIISTNENPEKGHVHNVEPTRSYDVATDTWTAWGDCSVSCGLGQRERMRSCGPTCKEMETMVCYAPACSDHNRQSKGRNNFLFARRQERPQLQESDYINPEEDACGKWMKCNKDAITSYLNQSSLPSCPCLLPLHLGYNEKVWDHEKQLHFNWVEIDKTAEGIRAYKPGAATCIRSKLKPGTETLAAQTCCYDDLLELITRGKGAGTPNLVSPEMSPELHNKLDISPWIICKGDWTRYNSILPPDNQRNCKEHPDDKIIAMQIKAAKNY